MIKYCLVCGCKMNSKTDGWVCPNCNCYQDTSGNFHSPIFEKRSLNMTNADRIRSMTDEQLAKFIIEEIWNCNECPSGQENMDNPFGGRCDEKCAKHCLEWLKQPAKGE